MGEPDLYVAREGATFEFNGQPVFVTAGVTIVRAGHPILKEHGDLFQPLRIHYDVEKPPPPPEKPAVHSTRADQQGARSRSHAAKGEE